MTGNYKTKQTYSYDNLYQLIKVDGETTYNPYQSSVPEFKSNYSQTFAFDDIGLGNMTSKVSSESITPQKTIGDNLNYSFAYNYDENYTHRLSRAGDRYYKYDANGNIVCEQDGSFEGNGEEVSYHKITQESENVYSTDYGWGLFKEEDKNSGKASSAKYKRSYKWDERNQLVSSVDDSYSTAYIYGQDGQRSNKYTASSETLYFNKMWTHHTDSGNNVYGGQTAKNIYLGDTRIVTKLNSGHEPTYNEEYYKQYYYHSDHLGSASLITDYKGDEYQRIEYTPYGETWVEKTSNTGLEYLPYKFTGKEIDEETGLYYYGARYLDPRYSRWISSDPALGEYIPGAGKATASEAGSLPGMGGIFNTVNLQLYHYAGNNPVKYTDPDGRDIIHLLDSDRGRSGIPILNKIAFGHAAALIGSDEKGWLYYSNDGATSTDVQWFDSVDSFFETYSNGRQNPFNFKENGRVETTNEQDKAMQAKAFELAGIDAAKGFNSKNSGKLYVDKNKIPTYRFLTNNCSEHVADIANAGGLFSIGTLIPKLQIIMNEDTYTKILKIQEKNLSENY